MFQELDGNETNTKRNLRQKPEDRQSICSDAAIVKPYIIFNPAAGPIRDHDSVVARLKELRPIALRTTRRKGDAERWARDALCSKANAIIVAGGDGTLNEVVNGLGTRGKRMVIGLLPRGTGNDFARTLGLPTSIEENIDIIRAGKTRRIDLVRVKSKGTRYFVNMSAGGFSGMVDKKITRRIKRTWGPLTYIRGAAAALPKMHGYKTKILFDDDEELTAELYNVVVANGRFVAGGLPIAPTAEPDDGFLEVVLFPKRGAPEMALLAAAIVLGKHLSNNATILRRAKKVAIRSNPGMWFNVDGELVGSAPATFQLVPLALKFIVK